MRVHRFILAVLFALAWVVSTNSCLLAAAFAPEVETCCEESGEREQENHQPCGANDCAKCVTLESGLHFGALQPIVAPAAIWTEDALLSESLQRRMELSAQILAEIIHPPPVSESLPLWCEMVTRAVPTRGPSGV